MIMILSQFMIGIPGNSSMIENIRKIKQIQIFRISMVLLDVA